MFRRNDEFKTQSRMSEPRFGQPRGHPGITKLLAWLNEADREKLAYAIRQTAKRGRIRREQRGVGTRSHCGTACSSATYVSTLASRGRAFPASWPRLCLAKRCETWAIKKGWIAAN